MAAVKAGFQSRRRRNLQIFRTVVLITEHNDEGAMGIVLNRPSETMVDEVVPELAEVAGDDAPVYVGGPVQPEALVLLAEFSDPSAAAWIVAADVGLASADVDLMELASVVRRGRVYAGYSGWAPGQLEAEMELDSWIVEPPLPAEHAGRVSEGDGVREDGAEDGSDHSRGRGDEDAVHRGADDAGAAQGREVADCHTAIAADECPGGDDQGRKEEEDGHVGEERHSAEPVERKSPAALPRAAGGHRYSRTTGCGQILGQLAPRYAFAAVAWVALKNCGVPLTFGNFAAAAASTVPDFSIAAWRTGRARPLSQRFWPSSEYRYSSQRRAAAGWGAVLLTACA